MTERLFFVVYIGDPWLQAALDAIRFVANPEEKWPAHVTARGPYHKDHELPNDLLMIEGKSIHITGVGDFFEDGGNAVFLRCDSPILKQVWDKPHFGYTPHITIYDGSSKNFAKKVRKVLDVDQLDITFKATGLSRMVSIKGDQRNRLTDSIAGMGLSWLARRQVSRQQVIRLRATERLTLLHEMWQQILAHFRQRAASFQSELFPRSDMGLGAAQASRPLRTLEEVVVASYLESHQGNSVDRVLADPGLNGSFVRRCWELDTDATESELNRALLRVRKSGRLGVVPSVQPFTTDGRDLDKYSWAVEFALRMLQDEVNSERQAYVSIDEILCNPVLGHRFEQLARSLVPGRSASEYRWAAIVLRKQYNRFRRTPPIMPHLANVGPLNELDAERLSNTPGLFQVCFGDTPVFAGQSRDIGDQLRRLRASHVHQLPHICRPVRQPLECAMISVAEESVTSARLQWRAGVVKRDHPLLNLNIGSRLAG